MPQLAKWYDEAAVVHWTQESSELPDWQKAHYRMLREGRFSHVDQPSPAHVARQITEPKPSLLDQTLRPIKQA